MIRRTAKSEGYEYKYSLTNAEPVQYTEKAMAYMQAQRYFVEHNIKESKQVFGMSEYQTRKWQAWEHQVAINIMVMGFMLKEKLISFNEVPLLSARDIREWIGHFLMKERSDEDLVELMIERHKRRQTAINQQHLKDTG